MARLVGKIRRQVLGIAGDETSFAVRGFHDGELNVRRHLEHVGESFLIGYHLALSDLNIHALKEELDGVQAESRGFAYEGASMALALLDNLLPWKGNRVRNFLSGPGAAHTYMVHVGVGWAIGRLFFLRRRVDLFTSELDALLRWLAIDGYGFHEGYFHWPKFAERQQSRLWLQGYAGRAFDQGLGRSLWFVQCADTDRISATIGKFAASRQADLWSGVGLACAYAGGVGPESIKALRQAAGPRLPQLAQGAAFAAKARQRAGNPTHHTEVACRILCGMAGDAAALITDEALDNLDVDIREPAYEVWRKRIQSKFVSVNSA